MIAQPDPSPLYHATVQSLQYVYNKRPSPSSQWSSALLVLTGPDISIDRFLSLLSTRACPLWRAKPWHRCLFLIASLLSVGKYAIGQANTTSTQKMPIHLSQVPHGI